MLRCRRATSWNYFNFGNAHQYIAKQDLRSLGPFDPRTSPVLRIMKSIALRFAAFLILTAASTSLLALPYLVGP